MRPGDGLFGYPVTATWARLCDARQARPTSFASEGSSMASGGNPNASIETIIADSMLGSLNECSLLPAISSAAVQQSSMDGTATGASAPRIDRTAKAERIAVPSADTARIEKAQSAKIAAAPDA